jgi:hypothetical protein
MDREAPTGGGTAADRVRAAIPRTLAEGTASLIHEHRIGDATREPDASGMGGEGWIDFTRRRSWYAATPAFIGSPNPVDNYWIGATMRVRFGPEEPWSSDSPLVGVPPGFTPYSSPFWLLDAVCGCRGDAAILADDAVGEVPTTRIRLTIDFESASRCSPYPLHVPRRRASSMPAEAWIDREGRFRRLACTWDLRPWWIPRRFALPQWMTTEFLTFGVTVDSPTPPSD